jgi:hypothetical protein
LAAEKELNSQPPSKSKGALSKIKESATAELEQEEVKQEEPKGPKRPHSPINKELLYMDNVENHLKKQGLVPKMKVDDIVVNSSASMQIIDMITKRYKGLGRVDEGNDFLRLLRKVFFP